MGIVSIPKEPNAAAEKSKLFIYKISNALKYKLRVDIYFKREYGLKYLNAVIYYSTIHDHLTKPVCV